MLLLDEFTCFYQIVYALFRVGYLHGTEQKQFLVGRQVQAVAHLCFVQRTEQVGVDGIRDIGYGMSQCQHTVLGQSFEPSAACNECDVSLFV